MCSERDPHERGVIAYPGLVAAADESLVTVPAAAVLLGITARTVLLISPEQRAQTWKARLLACPLHPAGSTCVATVIDEIQTGVDEYWRGVGPRAS